MDKWKGVRGKPPVVSRHFTNLDERWRSCEMCGSYYATRPGDDAVVYGGRLRPETDLTEYQGKWYCPWHFEMRWGTKLYKEAPLNIKEIDDV